jgi:hypothetical protein
MVPSVKHLNLKGMEADTPTIGNLRSLCPYFAISLLPAEHSLRSRWSFHPIFPKRRHSPTATWLGHSFE